MTETRVPAMGPLDMARNAAAAVLRYAQAADTDDPQQQLDAYVFQFGQRQHSAANLAGQMALVSIAQDLHRIVNIMTGQVPGRLADEDAAAGEGPA
jgi:hypothetical protein